MRDRTKGRSLASRPEGGPGQADSGKTPPIDGKDNERAK